jgi:hypothetical protein
VQDNIRDIAFLVRDYGGDPLKWSKRGGLVITDYFRYDIHWYELDGVQYKSRPLEVKQLKKKGIT